MIARESVKVSVIDIRQFLQTAFGAGALVGLRNDVLTRFSVVSGSLPLEADSPAQQQTPGPNEMAGVICGGPAKFMALVFRAEQSARHFLQSNSALSVTLVTGLGERSIVWLRPTNQLPPSVKLQEVQVISHGVVPVYAGSKPRSCTILQFGKPAQLDLTSLVFPPNLAGFFAEASRREKFGPPLLELGPRKRVLNGSYWADLICQGTDVRFDPGREIFVQHPEQETEKVIRTAELGSIILAVLRSRQASVQIPSEELQPKRVKAIIEAMKLSCVLNQPTEEEAFMEFVQEALERRVGEVLSKDEAAKACRRFFQSRNWRSLARMVDNKLRHKMAEAIFKQFGVGESHDRGRVFRALGLRLASGGDHHERQQQAAKLNSPTASPNQT